jgi:hypothetical protein
VFTDTPANAGYTLQQAASESVPVPGVSGPFTIVGGEIVSLHHADLSPGHWEFTAAPCGNLPQDIGISVYGPSGTYAAKLDTVAHGISNLGGALESESCLVHANAPGAYAIAVWKTSSSGLAQPTSYELIVNDDPRPPAPHFTRIAWLVTPFPRMEVEWVVRPGWRYGLEYADTPWHWQSVATTFDPVDDGVCTWIDDGSETGGQPEGMRFYRAYAFPP